MTLPIAAVSHLTAGRSQIGTSLSFHLFFAVLGVGLPLMMLVAEGMHLRTGDPVWRALARRWSKVFAVLFAVGAVSGTIISFELGLLFPRFMAYAGGIIGLPFSLEGAAFFIEAIFVGIYLYGWDRLSPRAHWLSGFPIAISAVASAFFIVTANAWMNVPRGFQIVHGRVTHVDPLAAMFNPAWATETSHMVFGAYLATAFGIASVYAVGMLRGRRDSYHRKAIAVALSMAAILAPLQLAVGDLLGRTVANHQPATLAAIEGVTHTERGAGLNIGGFPLPGHNGDVLNVKVPHLLSLLAFDNPNTPVRGLDTFPKADRTPLAPYVAPGLHRHGRHRHRPRRAGPVVLAAPAQGNRRARGPTDLDGARGGRSGGVPGQRARLAGQRTGTPAVDRLRGVSNLERDHHRTRARRDLHRLHAALPRADRAHLVGRATYRRDAGPGAPCRRPWRWPR